MKIGYSFNPLTINARTDKKVFSKSFSKEIFLDACGENLKNLKTILIHNIHNDIEFFKINPNIIPLASDPINDVDWSNIFESELSEIGSFIKENNIRICTSPNTFTIINSPNEKVVQSSITELTYLCDLLDSLKLDNSHKIILTIGGVYADKSASINRFLENFNKLPDRIKNRLVLANDDKNYGFLDVFGICNSLNIPMVLDKLYNDINKDNEYPLYELIHKIAPTWKEKDGKMILLYSQQNHAEKKGVRSNTIFIDEFLTFYNVIKDLDLDIMLKVNDKDISALKCLNILNELNGHTYSSEYMNEEYERYKLLLLERGKDFSIKALATAQTSTSLIEFYKVIDHALESFIKPLEFSYALRDALKLIQNDIKPSEKNHVEKLILNNKFKRCKSYMHEVALRNNAEKLLKTYFFSEA